MNGTMSVSVLIPVYNEKLHAGELFKRVCARPEPDEIVIVDDGSRDGTADIIEAAKKADRRIKIVRHESNKGKGVAIRTGLGHVSGDIVIIQDADLEYNPQDYGVLLAPFLKAGTDVVYGSRMLNPSNKFSYLSFAMGGILLSAVTSVLFLTRITDEPTGYKVFRRSVLRGIRLESTGFEFCPEITAKVLRKGLRIHEVPISYAPRTIKEGKKIRLRDGIIAIVTLIKYRFATLKSFTLSDNDAGSDRRF